MSRHLTKNCWIQYETSMGDSTTFSIRCHKKEDIPLIDIVNPFIQKYVKPKRGDTVDYMHFVSGERCMMFRIKKRVNIDEIDHLVERGL